MPISIWAMNFALMFALALGIDYAMFIVYRFRGAFFGSDLDPVEATAQTMDTAGKAVLFSGLTVLISLTAVMLVPSPAFRSMSLGIMLAVIFVLAATLTLLPAVLARLGPKVDKLSLPWVHSGEHRSARFAAWGERLWRRPLAYGIPALGVLLLLAFPVTQLRTAMPSIKVVPPSDSSRVGYRQVQAAFGPGATGPLQLVASAGNAAPVTALAKRDPGIAQVLPPRGGRQTGADRSDAATRSLQPGCRPDHRAIRARAARGHAPRRCRGRKPRSRTGPFGEDTAGDRRRAGPRLPALADRSAGPVDRRGRGDHQPAGHGAAFGVAKWIFQDGALHSLLGFQPQGFLDAWGPVFFFAMIFAISMDYTVFLLSSAKEHWDRSHDAKDAMVSGLAHSGRVIFAAAAVMVAVFFTFALSGPLPPKEMGVILGVAVLLDAMLIRLLLVPVLLRLLGNVGLVPAALGAPRSSRGAVRARLSPGGSDANLGPQVNPLAGCGLPRMRGGPTAAQNRPHDA